MHRLRIREILQRFNIEVPVEYLEEGTALPPAVVPAAPPAASAVDDTKDLTNPPPAAFAPPQNNGHADRRLLRLTGLNSTFMDQAAGASMAALSLFHYLTIEELR